MALLEIDQLGWERMDPAGQALIRRHPFLVHTRPTEVLPPDLRRTWLLSGGRGAGKTRAGAEWVRWAVLQAG
jgi:phage terminase large subunit-like protein